MRMSHEEAERQAFDSINDGYCKACDDITRDSVEPDAYGYPCPCCDAETVMSASMAIMEGLIKVAS